MTNRILAAFTRMELQIKSRLAMGLKRWMRVWRFTMLWATRLNTLTSNQFMSKVY